MARQSERPDVVLVAAVARNGVIGVRSGLPWTLPSDLARFKATTLGKPVVMGRRTWDGLARALPGRRNIVITSQPDFVAEGAEVAPDLATALAQAGQGLGPDDEICVIGGGAVYAQAIGLADRLVLTEVDAEPEGDTLFPAIDATVWHVTREEPIARGPRDSADMTFRIYERRPDPRGSEAGAAFGSR